MEKTYSFRSVVAASVLAAVLSLAAFWLLHAAVLAPEPVWAQSSTSPGIVLYAAPAASDSETFIFHDTHTGDIWVYRNRKFKRRYRLSDLGSDMERLD